MSMNYEEVLEYLYHNLPMFQRIGGAAFKKDLSNTIRLCNYLGNPEHSFRSVHIAGTNGKGSSSHYIASILQAAGYRTGLYTSPHLKSFTERIRIDGKEVRPAFVTEFVNRHLKFIEELRPSFFEITVGMAIDYFRQEKVDIAVVEVGMGGRLDSTNVIIPEVALITNISPDHQQWLGNTLEEIAGEKAGIVKAGVPLVIGENQPGISHVFEQKAASLDAPLYKAFDQWNIQVGPSAWTASGPEEHFTFNGTGLPKYQEFNLPGVLTVAGILREKGYTITREHLKAGIENMKTSTGLKGRWDVIGRDPLVICDVGHNVAGIQYIIDQLARYTYENLHMVLGMVADKDIAPVLGLLPANASYYFCEAKIPRAMKAADLAQRAADAGLQGRIIPDVNEALKAARENAGKNDLIFVGGSNFVVAEINEL